MDAVTRKKTLLEHKASPILTQNKIGFGNKRAMSEGHRFYYENEGLMLIGKKEGLFIHGVRNGNPTLDYILIPSCTRLLTAFKNALFDCYDDLSIDVAFESTPFIVNDFIFHQNSLGEAFESASRGRYGSRFRGMVVTRGLRFKIHLGTGVFIQPLISKNEKMFGDELQESKAYIAVPANRNYFKRMAEAVENYQSEMFFNSVMEMTNGK